MHQLQRLTRGRKTPENRPGVRRRCHCARVPGRGTGGGAPGAQDCPQGYPHLCNYADVIQRFASHNGGSQWSAGMCTTHPPLWSGGGTTNDRMWRNQRRPELSTASRCCPQESDTPNHRTDRRCHQSIQVVSHRVHRTYCYSRLLTCNSTRRKRMWGEVTVTPPGRHLPEGQMTNSDIGLPPP